MKNSVTLNNGKEMPLFGLGTWQSPPDVLEAAVISCVEAGYRHIDTAYMYQNEDVIGRALNKCFKEGKVKREDMFITTKLPLIGMRNDMVEHFMDLSLKNLQVDYIDMYLVHSPLGVKYIDDDTNITFNKDGEVLIDDTDLVAVWKGMEKMLDAGKAKAIGISNFNSQQITRVCEAARIRPANLQVELHAYFQQVPLRGVCEKYGIAVTAYSSLGSPGRTEILKATGLDPAKVIPDLLGHSVVKKIADNHKKSTGNVLLKHLNQKNIIVIPKSTNPKRIKQNFEIFDFELTVDEMKELDALDRGVSGRTFNIVEMFKGLEKHKENPMKIPF